jgi:glycosyltransferase involved in cell wall biosynthesis
MDVFLLPSWYEGFPVTLVEAQCSGLPCLISDAITPEVKITDLITVNSLSDSVGMWIGSINKILKLNRKGRADEIRKAGYDIGMTANELESFYLSLI